MSRATRRAVAASLVAAAASMAVAPTALNFDPWSWLVWGREVGRLDLDTTGGPSWKPFPVLVTAPVSVLGDAAPYLWMFLSRAGGILGLFVAGAVAARVVRAGSAPRWAPAVAATATVVFLALSPDATPRWMRTLAVGHSAALGGALTTWAIHAHLSGRRRTAWFALVAASLIRPEAWPFLVAYGAWLALRRPTLRCRAGVVGGWAATAVLWFGGDLWGSGSPVHGAETARSGPDTFGDRIVRVVEVTAGMVPAVVWVLAAVAVGPAATSWLRRRRDPSATTDGVGDLVLALTGLAAAWVAVVAGLTVVFGYAALSRFLISPAAAICIVAAVGVVQLAERVRRPGDSPRPARGRVDVAIGGAVVVGLVLSASRVTGLVTVWDETIERGDVTADLTAAFDDAADAAGGTDGILACGQVTIEHRPLVRPQLAWLIDQPLHAVQTARDPVAPGVMFIVRDSKIDRHQTSQPVERWRELAANDHWRVLAIRCPVLVDTPDSSAGPSLDDRQG